MGLNEEASDEQLPAKEQLKLIFVSEADRLFQNIQGRSYTDAELKRAAEIARGLKEVESIPSPKKRDKEIGKLSTEELLAEEQTGESKG